MDEKKTIKDWRSECCNAEVVVAGKTTHYYICIKCNNICDAYLKAKNQD
jgi:hypothetical protein